MNGPYLRHVARATAIPGALLFLLAVLVHPKRDGPHIAEVGQLYGVTHGLEAVGLLLQALGLVALAWLGTDRLRPRDLTAVFAALLGTIWYFGLIVVDGTRNPVTAKYAPELVHTSGDLDSGTAIIVLPALVLFPLGYVLLGLLQARHGARSTGLLLGAGAVVYTVGGLAIFGLGPASPAIEVLEIVGVVPYTIGFVLMTRSWSAAAAISGVRPAPARREP
ncbi:hypothetical protein ACPPVO_43885 [Dactylosporangium sp. McL0621]|uniref:hypothetical protein n=1 Tax=Dactylosporangium sp. McL0621 TaxID=3415678 RepID=UPI003CF7FA50